MLPSPLRLSSACSCRPSGASTRSPPGRFTRTRTSSSATWSSAEPGFTLPTSGELVSWATLPWTSHTTPSPCSQAASPPEPGPFERARSRDRPDDGLRVVQLSAGWTGPDLDGSGRLAGGVTTPYELANQTPARHATRPRAGPGHNASRGSSPRFPSNVRPVRARRHRHRRQRGVGPGDRDGPTQRRCQRGPAG